MKTLKLLTFALFTFFASVSYAGPNEDLVAACKSGDLAKATAAIAAGADVNHLTEGNAPIASAFFWPEITRLLLDKGADPNLGNQKALFQASMMYSIEVVKMLLDAGADPNKPSLTDPTTLFKTLIATEKAKGATANQALINTWTTVMASAKPSEVYVLQQTVYGTSCAACVDMLLAKGAKLDKGVTDGTLLHTYANSTGKSKELWKQGFTQGKGSIEGFGLKLPDWYSAEMPADRFGSAEDMLKLLLSKGLNINEKNKSAAGPLTPLEISMGTGFGGHPEIMLALINNGADVNMVSETYGPMIFQASQTGFVDVVKAMVAKGADVNASGKFFAQSEGVSLKGYTPLIIAALNNRTELVKYLIEAGAKSTGAVEGQFSAPNGCLAKLAGKTAIFYAIENESLEMVKFMVEHKAFTNGERFTYTAKKMGGCLGGGGYSPLSYAKELGKTDVYDYLKSQGVQ